MADKLQSKYEVVIGGKNSKNLDSVFKIATFAKGLVEYLGSDSIVDILANTALKLSGQYTPYLSGAMYRAGKVTNGAIEYPGIPYAHRLFVYGKNFNFTRDPHPNATYAWLLQVDTATFVNEVEKQIVSRWGRMYGGLTVTIGTGAFGTGFAATGGSSDKLLNHVEGGLFIA